MGAIFCHVKIIKQFIQFNPSITSGNQKWNGAAPILVKRAELNIIIMQLFNNQRGLKFIDIKTIANIKIVDAKAWVMKYFIDASEENILFLLFIRGIIDNRLISKPIHIPIQVLEDIAISVPIIIDNKNSNL